MSARAPTVDGLSAVTLTAGSDVGCTNFRYAFSPSISLFRPSTTAAVTYR